MDGCDYVYIFTNAAMPDWVKVGRTDCIENRLNELSNTSVPFRFECYADMKYPNEYISVIESDLHEMLGDTFDKEKEFFRTSPEIVYSYFQKIARHNKEFILTKHHVEAIPEDNKSVQTTFELLQIPVGAVLKYKKDESVECIVADNKSNVRFGGTIASLSGVAKLLLQAKSARGSDYFKWPDSDKPNETLTQRRERLHPELKL